MASTPTIILPESFDTEIVVDGNSTTILSVTQQGLQGIQGKGIVAGGNVLDVIVKASTTDYDVRWANINEIVSLVNRLDNLGDVDINAAYFGQYLRYNGSVWQNSNIQISEVENLNSTLLQISTTIDDLTTSDITEGTNLYFTDNRAKDAVGASLSNTTEVSLSYNTTNRLITANIGTVSGTKLVDSSTPLNKLSPMTENRVTVTSASGVIVPSNITTTELGYLSGVTSNIQTQLDSKVISVNGESGVVLLDTTDIPEGNNLYYTTARFDTRLASKTTTDLAEGVNLYYTNQRFDTRFTTKTTDNLAEGNDNLYYTTARANLDFDNRLLTKNTDNLAEGSTNLYFTNTRARSAISSAGDLSYNSSTGVMSFTDQNAFSTVSVNGTNIAANLRQSTISFVAGTGITLTGNSVSRQITISNAYESPVSSVFGRVGNVVAVSGDYTTSLITNNSNVTGVTTTDALNSLDTRISSIDTTIGDLHEVAFSGSYDDLEDKPFIPSTTTDITEGTNLYFTDNRAKDAVGGAFTDTATINFTYDDVARTISADITLADGSIPVAKLGTLVANRALITNASGVITPSNVTNTDLSYVGGVTSPIQTQLNNKQALNANLTALAGLNNTSGLLEQTGTNTFTKRSIGVVDGASIPTRADADARYAAIVHTHTADQITDFDTAVDARITVQKAQPNGLATLDSSGLIPSNQLPAAVDQILEFPTLADFPVTGEANKIYIALDTHMTYRWSGSTYVEISPSAVTSVNGLVGAVVLTTTEVAEGSNLYYTNTRFDTRLASKTTTDLAEGDNLYHTTTRVNDAVASLIQDSTGVSWTYDPVVGTLTPTITVAGYDNEMAQDAVGGILEDTTTVTLSYDDSTPSITATVIPNTTVQRVESSKAGTLISTRKRINFIDGANTSITISDDSANDRTNITVAVTGLSTVATSGSYEDLSNKPTIPTTTTQISEGTNLYYTDARVGSYLEAGDNITLTPTGGKLVISSEGGTTINELNDVGDVTITSPSEGQILTYDADNDIWINADPASDSVFDITVDYFTGDGVTDELTLSKAPIDKDYVILTIDGVTQSNFIVTGSKLILPEIPYDGADIQVKILDISNVMVIDNVDSFKTINVVGEGSIVATNSTDTLSLVAGTGISLDVDSLTKTITLTNSSTGFSGDYDDLTNKPNIPSTFDDLSDGTTNKAFTQTLLNKLNGIAAGAEVNTVTSVAGRTGSITLYNTDISGLGSLATKNSVAISDISTTGTASSTTYLRGDGTWSTPDSGGGVTDGDKGDITVTSSGTVWTIDNLAVTTGKINGAAITTAKLNDRATTFIKMQTINTNRLLGRSTASTGSIEELELGSRLTLSSGVLNVNETTNSDIANNAVTYGKIQNVTASRLLGRATATTGIVEEITLGSTLAFTSGALGVGTGVTQNTATQTLTNKRITPRVSAVTAATVAVNANSFDIVEVSGTTGSFTISAPTGTPTQAQPLIYRFSIDNSSGVGGTLTWNSAFVAVKGVTLPTTLPSDGQNTVIVSCIWNNTFSRWDVTGVVGA